MSETKTESDCVKVFENDHVQIYVVGKYGIRICVDGYCVTKPAGAWTHVGGERPGPAESGDSHP